VPYVEFPAGDGDVAGRSFRAARALGLEWCRLSRWHPGLLVSCAVRGGVPAVETELGGLGIQEDETHRRYRAVVDRLLRHLGLLSGDPPPAADTRVVRHREVPAPVGGVLWRSRRLGDRVSRGDVVATVRDLHGRPLAEVASPLDGVVAAYRLCSSVNPGDPVITLFEETADEVAGPGGR
jgi:predicted deacylase